MENFPTEITWAMRQEHMPYAVDVFRKAGLSVR